MPRPTDCHEIRAGGGSLVGHDFEYHWLNLGSAKRRQLRDWLALPAEQQKGTAMPQTLFSQSAQSRAKVSAEQREAIQVRSDVMELIAKARHAIAQSRVLIAEADTLVRKRSRLGTMPQGERDSKGDTQ
jgi:hypothetical protein